MDRKNKMFGHTAGAWIAIYMFPIMFLSFSSKPHMGSIAATFAILSMFIGYLEELFFRSIAHKLVSSICFVGINTMGYIGGEEKNSIWIFSNFSTLNLIDFSVGLFAVLLSASMLHSLYCRDLSPR